ncbi:phosphoglycerate mutase-like protein [Hypoxylon fragiforme]|uniref:phosphoglycerate mutase-like protein n=1 Tax=Hypoxylon fragiforme TaxID=63214 RepID=UPI0020C5D04D|nr:phosphoglycerate mutase-like protein [Hypoxylon fragiforme]KAI2603423.1 phosphoglycerate mutase-like protein [Hypoxylon fragiforme]
MEDEKTKLLDKEELHAKPRWQRRGNRRWSIVLILGLALAAILLSQVTDIISIPSSLSHHRKKFNLYEHLGHRSPIFVPPNTPASLHSGTPPDCTVSKAFLIHRHGSRHPHASELAVVDHLSSYIATHRTLFSHPRAHPPHSWAFLAQGSWDGSFFHTDHLTASGRKQLFDHGVALRLHHPSLYTDSHVVAGDEDRVVESARWFMDGYYGRASNATASLRVVGEGADTVSWITPHASCPRWSERLGEDVLPRWREVYLPPIAARINRALGKAYPGVGFTAEHVQGMFYACAYGTAVQGIGSSPWCEVFLPREILENEYESDLLMRGFAGYGLPGDMGAVLGSLLVGNVTAFLQSGEAPNLSLGFGHDKTIAMGLTALGLAFDKAYPVEGPVDPKRAWRAAKQMPFAASMFWKRLECKHKDRIQLVLDGANFGLGPTGCKTDKYGTCALEDFVSTGKVQAALNFRHGDDRWREACLV